MAHWFHRNQLKATTALSFDFGPKAASSLARNICIDTKLARAALLNILPDPNKDVDELTTKFDAYIGLLLGFVNPTEAPSGHQPPPQSQPKPEAQDQENPTESEGDSTEIASSGHQLSTLDSKLRNALKITWTNSLTSKTVQRPQHRSCIKYRLIGNHIHILFDETQKATGSEFQEKLSCLIPCRRQKESMRC
ncbi:putative BRO1 domain-containing protein BROX [Apostichopus japonicus]|uniref:Putative BRO1 domain-containing protein BROX n=1 Tax=Stichopus japonicus TaxID=307972 RepID=A0A2G8JH46_STIJA|nr:putative BRO1 domain-containing protein BROX [Apostichopus japonicus]